MRDLGCNPLSATLIKLAANHGGHAAFAMIGMAAIR